MTEELKPCPNPWCMAQDVSIMTVRMVNPKTQELLERKRVECTEGCGLCGPRADTDEAAAAAWNTRAKSAGIVSLRKLRDNSIEIAALRAENKRLRALATQGGEYAKAYVMRCDTNTGIPGAEQYLTELAQLPEES